MYIIKQLIDEAIMALTKEIPDQVKHASIPIRKKVGEILVEKGIITSLTVERILPICTKANKRLGTILEEIGLITSEELAQALAIQYGCKIVTDFAKYHYSKEVLQLIPIETAVEHLIFPLKIKDNILALAVYDPTDENVINNIKANINMQVIQFIGTRKDINKAIVRHYLGKDISYSTADTILIVDDDRLIVDSLTDILNKEGYNIITASDGMEAYKEIISHNPKLIITDKIMPKFNGYDLLNSIKNIPETNRIPVILISGANNPDEEATAFEKGFFDYISKPISAKTLKARVKRALKSNNNLISLHSLGL
jgi:CheY-like chemotaxis protein